jgi:hypothetical protein
MQMIAHHSEGQHVDPELSCEKLQTLLNPLLAVIKALPGVLVRPTQERATHAPIDAVVNADLVFINNVLPWHTSHDCPLGKTIPIDTLRMIVESPPK